MEPDDLAELDIMLWSAQQPVEKALFEWVNPEQLLHSLPHERKLASGAEPSPMSVDVHDGSAAAQRVHASQPILMRAWNAAQRSTTDDWSEWVRGLSIELLKESPSGRLCCVHARLLQPSTGRWPAISSMQHFTRAGWSFPTDFRMTSYCISNWS